MVSRIPLARFRQDESGLSLTEALIVMPIMIFIMAIIVEFSAALMQWNQVVKASQVAGRFAAVSDPLTNISTLDFAGIEGDPTPGTVRSVSCGYGTTACDAVGLQRLYNGGDGVCGAVNNRIRGVCDIAPFVPANNIRITYSNGGLGYVGRPSGPVPVVTVEIVDIPFNFFALGAVFDLFGDGSGGDDWTMQPFPVTFVGEDLSSCEGC